ncbi:conserved hypothetical protein [Methylobacterium nodulans ORS 2060]|uniref:Uncharacterized protein n=1 Tax=Methylobacterium nodulans (strain LMG 21967 / CNCM I-2342 / ORS 2060) TaxID=460265 RepID=B8ILX0_METNO|nr:conserved hypothetical protein [Methylobacterium nodulans ORS 2060]
MFLAAITLAFGAAGALVLGLRAAVSSEAPGEGPHAPGLL